MALSATVRARDWIVHRGLDTARSVAISMPLPAEARPMWPLCGGCGAERGELTENVSDVKRTRILLLNQRQS
jgi:hypothetical protein